MAERVCGNVKWFDASKGYGFISVTGKPDVFLHKLGWTGSEMPCPGTAVNFVVVTGKKGPQASSAMPQSEYEAKLKQEEEARKSWAQAEQSLDPPGFRVGSEVITIREAEKRGCPAETSKDLIARHRKHAAQKYGLLEERIAALYKYDSYYWDEKALQKEVASLVLQRKMKRLEEVLPLWYGGPPSELQNALTVVLPPEELEWVAVTSVWDNDGDPEATRPGARSYEVFHSTDEFIRPRGLEEGNVLMLVKGNVSRGGRQLSSDFRAGGTDVTTDVYECQVAERAVTSLCRVSLSMAQRLWAERCSWYLLPYQTLLNARYQAGRIMEARKVWEEEFPGIEPGSRKGALESLGIYAHETEAGGFISASFWNLPAFLLLEESELLAERMRVLQGRASAGDSKAGEALREEYVRVFWGELIESFQEASGLSWEYQEQWSSPVSGETAPVWAAFVGDSLAYQMATWYTRREQRAYYRLFEKDVVIPENYTPGSIEWRVLGQVPAVRDDR